MFTSAIGRSLTSGAFTNKLESISNFPGLVSGYCLVVSLLKYLLNIKTHLNSAVLFKTQICQLKKALLLVKNEIILSRATRDPWKMHVKCAVRVRRRFNNL